MKQGIYIALIVVILAVLGFFFLAERDSDKNEINLTPTQVYFAQEIQASSIKRNGQPIEGFEPQILMQAFPGFIHADFDKVKSQQGEYQVSNGAIAFINTDSGPEHSAARAITEVGMQTLLENVALRLELPLETIGDVDLIISKLSGPTTQDLIIGIWESTDDEKFTRKFDMDGTAVDRYKDDEASTSIGEWEIFTDLSLEPVDFPATDGATYLRIVFDEEAFYYIILEVTNDSLQLTYLNRGNILNFKKIIE